MGLKKREGCKIVDGRYVKNVKRDIKTKVKKDWLHLGEKTVVGEEVVLSQSEYFFCLDKDLIEESADQPRMLEV